MATPERAYIGLMSGTSLDGVDGVLVAFDERGGTPLASTSLRTLAHEHVPFDADLRALLLSLNTPGVDEIARSAQAGLALVDVYARVVAALLQRSEVEPDAIAAIGAHGQTVRHQPGGSCAAPGYTVQLNQPALLAERCGIDVIADFRSRDIAAGGQGAPLVPAFHAQVFRQPGECVAVANIGGIANLSVIDDGATIGFDCGPGNLLMDHWCARHTGRAYDDDGRLAALGRVLPALLEALCDDPFLAAAPPKSTGREHYHSAWLGAHLARLDAPFLTVDVQATLSAFTAAAIAMHVERHASAARTLVVCGGGALNGDLMRRLALALPGRRVAPSDDFGVPAMQVEACAFAWLARQFVLGLPGNLPAVTGASGPRRLGALYPAR